MIIADAKGEETEEEGKLSTAIAKRRGGEKTRNYGWESERVSDSGITTKGLFSTEKENLRYVDYLLYFMYLLIYL